MKIDHLRKNSFHKNIQNLVALLLAIGFSLLTSTAFGTSCITGSESKLPKVLTKRVSSSEPDRADPLEEMYNCVTGNDEFIVMGGSTSSPELSQLSVE